MVDQDMLENDQPLLIAESLSKSYGRITACRDVSFALYPGEVLAIVGESGSGKSTLLQLLSGQLAASGGQVSYRMRDGVTAILLRWARPSGASCSAPIGVSCTRIPRRGCAWRSRPAPMSASG